MTKLIEDISNITCNILDSSSLDDFENQIGIHESIISSQLGITPVKQKYFSDFEGSIKSLGAWGGDFIMATRNNKNYLLVKLNRDMAAATEAFKLGVLPLREILNIKSHFF